jgi:hypothetical protein
MKYIALIYGQEVEQTPEESQAELAAYGAFDAAARASGVGIVGGEALMPSATATTVRVRDGKTLTTDGPFAESKEVLGGFYVLECKDLDEAIATAALIPGALHGAVEVRPLVVFS